MSLWTEKYNELDRYYTYRKEAEQNRLTHLGQTRTNTVYQIFIKAGRSSASWLMAINHTIIIFTSVIIGLFEKTPEELRSAGSILHHPVNPSTHLKM
jgi:hypothetical protein